jgi:hypothetical protein
LKAIHLNDSKGALDSRVDRHQNIGHGEIGVECFRFLANDARFRELPIVLETGRLRDDVERVASFAEEIQWFRGLIDNRQPMPSLTSKVGDVGKQEKTSGVKRSSSSSVVANKTKQKKSGVAAKQVLDVENDERDTDDEFVDVPKRRRRTKTM